VSATTGGPDAAGLDAEFGQILGARRLTTLFQPIVELATSRVVGYEALSRGPRGSHFEAPEALFAHAYGVGRAAELDWACRAAAFRAALDAQMPPELTLFVNAEPASLWSDCPPDLLDAIQTGVQRLKIVVELTERYLADNPAGVLNAVFAARARGLGVAVDDLGAEPASLALMPLVRPDVIKLDLSLIQGRPDLPVARTVNGVLAEVERTGAAILAEGIESAGHAAMASAMGSTLGQGWRFGRPGPLPTHWQPIKGPPVPVLQHDPATLATPFEVVTRQRPTRSASRLLLRSLSKHLEYRAADPAEPGVLVTCLEDARYFDAALARRYAQLATETLMIAVFGHGMPAQPAPGVRGTSLGSRDPLAQEWAVVVIAAHFSAALVARRPRPGSSTSGELRLNSAEDPPYDFAVTYERDLAIAAAQSLVQRIAAPDPPAPR
jgi:EAL domain-containing protein (putative c-di-GMP-specific phosphodiesterase class I)